MWSCMKRHDFCHRASGLQFLPFLRIANLDVQYLLRNYLVSYVS
jgi:hypothetical protein